MSPQKELLWGLWVIMGLTAKDLRAMSAQGLFRCASGCKVKAPKP